MLPIIFCMAIGVAGARTAEHLEDARKADLLTQRAEAEQLAAGMEMLEHRLAAVLQRLDLREEYLSGERP